MNYKPSKAGEVFAAFTRLVEVMLYSSLIVTAASAIINLFTNSNLFK